MSELCKERLDIFIAIYNDCDALWYISVLLQFSMTQVLSMPIQATTRPRLSESLVPIAPSRYENPEFHEEVQASLRVAGRCQPADR